MGKNHEQKIAIIDKYAYSISTDFYFYVKGDIPSKNIDNALKRFAQGLDRNTIIGFYDTTVLSNGKMGYIFTDDKVYYLEDFSKPKKLWYDEIESVSLSKEYKKDRDKVLVFHMLDGSEIEWFSSYLNKTPLLNFFNEMLELIKEEQLGDNCISSNNLLDEKNDSLYGATAGGYAMGAYNQVNKSFDEEKFHANQGHGFAAEQANDLYDRLTGHDAKVLGDDFKKDGPDRIVDGVLIQTKYCATGQRCINECFEDGGNGDFRYLINGKPMQIEVPSDKYDVALQTMEEKIKNGQVPGVSDPNEAKNIVRKGHFTYEQAKNIAKAGTVESITYDAVNGAIIATTAFGITALITFASSTWNGEDFDTSIKLATFSGLKVGGTAFITTVIAGQLSKAGLNSALVGSSEAVIAFLGPKASAVIVNAFRTGGNIYGAAAMRSAAKLLRGNAITAGVTVVVLTSFDIANIFRGRISGKQLFKNFTNTAATVGGGTAGWIGGAAIGSAILPVGGTIIGGLIGSVVSGGIAGKASDAIMGNFIEDDAEEMVRIIRKVFEELSIDYLLNQKEGEKSVDKLQQILDGKKLKDMFASNNRRDYARELLVPIIEEEVKKRKHISVPSDQQMMTALKDVLEDISDNYEFDTV